MKLTTRNEPKSRIPKSAVALLVVASVFAAGGVIRNVAVASAAALPDPEHSALLAADRLSSEEIAVLWAQRSEAQPTNVVFRSRHASSLMDLASATGDLTLYEVAQTVAEDAVVLDPTNTEAQLTLAAALSGQHDFAGALAVIETALADDETSVAGQLALGDVHVELGNYEGADTAYAAAETQLDGQPPALLSRYARLASIRADTPRALELSGTALRAAGEIDLSAANSAFYWFQLSHYSFQTGDLATSESAIRSALIVDPGNLGATELLAKVLAARGKDDEAISAYRELLERGPAADLHGELAKLYTRAGRSAEAEEQIELGLHLAREQADRFPAERRHLIGFLADHSPAEALRLAELDLETRQDVTTHAWYAWALLQTGDARSALDALGPALALNTDDPLFLFQAGAIHAANGNVTLAETYLTSALDINPTFDVAHADTARQLLEMVRTR